MRAKNKYKLLFIPMIAAFAGILFGFDTGVISGAILYINHTFALDALMVSVVVGMVLLGAFTGALFSGKVTDHYGRKVMLLFDAVVFVIGTLISAFAPNVWVLIVGRFVVGFAIGIASYTAPLYIAEIAPLKYRGALVSLNQLTVTIGIFISYVVDYYFSLLGTAQWRWMLGAGVVPAVLLFLGVLTLPRSPRWLVAKGKLTLALATLRKVRHEHEYLIHKEFEKIKSSCKQEKGSWKMLRNKKIRPAFYIAAGLAVIQQVTGINTILYYAPTIFKNAGFASGSTAILATMVVGAVFVLSTVVALPLIDRIGRKPLLYIGMGIMTVGLACLAAAFHGQNLQSGATTYLAVFSMMLYIVGFGISLGPIMWLMIAEIFPLNARGFGSSIATGVNWGANWIVAMTFLFLLTHFGARGTFEIYATITLLSLIFVYAYVPETKGVSLEQIENNLYAGLPARELGRITDEEGEFQPEQAHVEV